MTTLAIQTVCATETREYQPRPFQEEANACTIRHLEEKNLALVIVPTGGGKTFLMGLYLRTVLPYVPDTKVLMLQHSETLLEQNMNKISAAIGHLGKTMTIVQAENDNWAGDIVFGSIASVSQNRRLEEMPAFTHVIIDEAHRAGSRTYRKTIKRLRALNPDVRILLYTATPNRGDGEVIAKPEDVAYQVSYAALINAGYLVPVESYVVDLGLGAALAQVKKIGDEYDMTEVSKILNKRVHNKEVVRIWKEKAKGRRTVAFCSTIKHANSVADAFRKARVRTAVVHSGVHPKIIKRILAEYERGAYDVLVNCMKLTEGWDDQQTSCVINLRMMAEEITFLQAVGRGMRSVDQNIYPGVIKENMLLLDFAGASDIHGTIETRVLREEELAEKKRLLQFMEENGRGGGDPYDNKEIITNVVMRQIDLMAHIDTRFVPVTGVGQWDVLAAVRQNGWTAVLPSGRSWYVLGGRGEFVKTQAFATLKEAVGHADKLILNYGASLDEYADEAPTDAQLLELRRHLINSETAIKNRYHAAVYLAIAKAHVSIRRRMRWDHAKG